MLPDFSQTKLNQLQLLLPKPLFLKKITKSKAELIGTENFFDNRQYSALSKFYFVYGFVRTWKSFPVRLISVLLKVLLTENLL